MNPGMLGGRIVGMVLLAAGAATVEGGSLRCQGLAAVGDLTDNCVSFQHPDPPPKLDVLFMHHLRKNLDLRRKCLTYKH
jgi:hypothetical protein